MSLVKKIACISGCLVFMLVFHLPVIAREYPMLHYVKETGLPSNTIYNLYRDSRGFMWIATNKGVARYNGISFELFDTHDGLPDNEIFSFQEDHQHRIWMVAFSGALCYYKNGIFHTPGNTPFLRLPLKPEHAIRINLEKDSSITVSYKNLTYFINIKDDSCRIYPNGRVKGEPSCVVDICKISDSIYCILTGNKTFLLNIHANTVTHKTFRQRTYSSIFQNQKYFFDATYIYDGHYKKLLPMPASLQKPFTTINSLYLDGKNFFITTDNGMYINNVLTLLKGKRVTTLTEDIAGNYWISTIGDGVYRISKDFRRNSVINNAYEGVVTYACSYQGTQYFATTARHLYQAKNGTVKMLLDYSNVVSKVRNQGNHIDCSINNHTLYCLGGNGYIFTYDILTGEIKRFIVPKRYTEFIKQGKWKSLIATKKGLNITATISIDFIPYTSFNTRQSIKQIINTSFNNRLYAAVSNGKNGIIHSRIDGIYSSVGGISTLQRQYGNRVFVWLNYLNNKLVGFTSTSGLYVLSAEGRTIKTDSFLSENIVWNNAFPISSDQLLLTSTRHYYTLSLAGPNTNAILPKPVENPFLPSDAEYILSDTANCYFFKNGDITVIAKDDLLKNVPAPVLYFNKVVVEDSIFRLGDSDSALVLSGGHTNARLSFDVVAFNAVDVIYEYRIVQDGNKVSRWEPVSNKELNLALPRYGDIKIFARVRTQGGISSVIKHFTIIISKPWWARWWGVAVIAFALLSVIALLFYFFTRSALRKKEKEHNIKIRILNAEFKSLNAMMNPHFIFNTLNNIQGFINADNKLQANEYIRTFSDMVRQNMRNISQELVTLADEMMIVESYLKLQCLRFQFISYDIDIASAIDMDDFMIPPLLIQPLVENSIKHGILPLGNIGGHISIQVDEAANETVTIAITDNGIGLSRSEARESSFALDALRKRIDTLSVTHKIHISFEISDHTNATQASGTRVLLTISYRS